MIKIADPQKKRSEIKKLFKGCMWVTLKFCPHDNAVSIGISGTDHNKSLSYSIDAEQTYNSLQNNIILTNVELIDCVWDVIFSKDGFYIDAYQKAYSELTTHSKSGSDGWISQVIFKSKTKKRDFIAPCNPYVKMIF